LGTSRPRRPPVREDGERTQRRSQMNNYADHGAEISELKSENAELKRKLEMNENAIIMFAVAITAIMLFTFTMAL
jgi:hypothetical protein